LVELPRWDATLSAKQGSHSFGHRVLWRAATMTGGP
jgi:hypothetical protein